MLVLLLTGVACMAAASFNVVHEKRSIHKHLGAHLKRTEIDSNSIIPVRIALKQRNIDHGLDHLLDISDPSSKNYGRLWTSDQIIAEFGASTETAHVVTNWLARAGIVDVQLSRTQDWVTFDAPLSVLENLLTTKYYAFEQSPGSTVRIGCDKYSLPSHVAPHVDYITPGVMLSPAMHKVKRRYSASLGQSTTPPKVRTRSFPTVDSNSLSSCGYNITPPCIRALYALPDPGSVRIASDGLGVFEAYGEYNQTELDEYYQTYAPYVPQGTHPKNVTLNRNVYSSSDAESNLDFDMVYGLLGPAEVTLYQTAPPEDDSHNPNIFDSFWKAIDSSYCTSADRRLGYQCGGANLTEVVSFSYSFAESLMVSANSQRRTCNEFMKYGLQGHTFVVASGDYGVASAPALNAPLCSNLNSGCLQQDLNNSLPINFNGTVFSPGFPATCPYVLAVGGTQLYANETVQDPESVMNVENFACGGSPYSSGGGFSNYFKRPSYQNASVESYFSKYDPGYKYYQSNGQDAAGNKTNIGKNGGIYNRLGRAFPDVAANGANFTLFQSSYLTNFVGKTLGTSASAPLWASIIALLNAKRREAGKGPVGFVNPTLYKNPQAFHDITNGNNPGCSTNGFAAVPGWDPVTGLGTPNFPKLLEAFMSLP